MAASVYVKIRGIYTTALTRLLLDHGYKITRPSPQIQQRFALMGTNSPEDILIRDRRDHQGVLISGNREQVARLISLLRNCLLDMVVRPAGFKPWQAEEGLFWEDNEQLEAEIAGEEAEMELEIEFPAVSKATLDAIREQVTPTVKNHHLLKIVSPSWVDLVEEAIRSTPWRKAELEDKLWEDIILRPLRQQRELIGLIHVHPEGRELSLRGGKILHLERDCLLVRREFSEANGQQYDGLELPIEPGDYGITQVSRNGWFLQHSYYSQDGLLRGTYWNINTPVEFYPDRIRYLDLHIDVVQRSGEAPRLIDQEKLDRAVACGLISPKLARCAREVAKSLLIRGS
ncbi:MAG: DUF402 domain-containing protein [bacterium]|nr:DUF402 domain-containing protein [bacterium]